MNNNTQEKEIQEVKEFLIDNSKTGKVRKWKEKKIKSITLSMIYGNLSKRHGNYYKSKAIRIRKCSNFLTFRIMSDGTKRLINGGFCRVCLCPMCSWRRSLKVYANMTTIMKHMQEYKFIFLTLTIRSCEPQELKQSMADMFKAWHRFMGYKNIEVMAKGWYRGLEFTHNIKKNTYHPHFHVVIAVNKSYFTDKIYIKQEEWTNLWSKAMKLDYTPIVDIRKVKGNTAKAVAEIAKYTVKDNDYIDPHNLKMSEEAVLILDDALYKCRLVAYGGIMKDLHKKLNLEDEAKGSLENSGIGMSDDSKAVVQSTYVWNTGYRNYIKVI